ncbi:MAG: hypothetical protein WCB52_07640, partial [Pseudolabrys sp.]
RVSMPTASQTGAVVRPEGCEISAMKIYIFKSEANDALHAFAGDEDGSRLPAGFAPWCPEGVVEAGRPPPHNLSRIRIEGAIRLQGFQLWRTKRAAVADSEA